MYFSSDSFENLLSLEQDLTFEAADREFSERNVSFGEPEKKALGLINEDDIYTNLGLLLSEQCPHDIKMAVFQGTDQSVFKGRREFSGSLMQQLKEVYDYIDFRNQTHSTFDKLRRIDIRDYPEVALREALINSVVHRNYGFSASTNIKLYDDRIEFTSIGGLMPGVSLDDVMMGLSVCRNPKLANVFYRLELIEAYGTGIEKIMNAYKNSGKAPVIKTTDNAFKIILPNRNAVGLAETPEGISGDSYESEVQKYLRGNYTITRKDAESILGLSQSSAGRILRQMVKEGFLVCERRGRDTRYHLNKKE